MFLLHIFGVNRSRAGRLDAILASDDPIEGLLSSIADGYLHSHLREDETEAISLVAKTTSLPLTAVAREHLKQILVSDRVRNCLEIFCQIGLLQHLFPEVVACAGVPHSGRGIRDVFDHLLEACRLIEPSLHMRLAALLHDIGKRDTIGQKDGRITFHGHQVTGSLMAYSALKRLGYSDELADRVCQLIRYHMFEYTATDGQTPIRRLVAKMGTDAVKDLLELRRADVVASGGDCTHAWPLLRSLARELEQIRFEDSRDADSS